MPLPEALPNFTLAPPTAGVAASGAFTATVQSSVAFCVQFRDTTCIVPLASYTLTCEVTGVLAAGVAGRLAVSVTVDVGIGLSAVWSTLIGPAWFWLMAPVTGSADQPFRAFPASLTR